MHPTIVSKVTTHSIPRGLPRPSPGLPNPSTTTASFKLPPFTDVQGNVMALGTTPRTEEVMPWVTKVLTASVQIDYDRVQM